MAPLLHRWYRKRGRSSSRGIREDRKGNPPRSYGAYAGPLSSVADGERLAIALALEEEDSPMITLATDSQAAVQTIHNLSRGKPPRSQIEARIKKALMSDTRDIGILWVRGHTGITGNEKADKRAEYESFLGEISGKTSIATEEGVRAMHNRIRKSHRQQPGFNPRTCEWSRQAISAYTWTRTERGPQNKWLHHVKKANSPACNCGAPEESGHHLVFECPRHAAIRGDFLAGKKSWEELYKPDWRKAGEGEDAWYFEAVEEFFGHLYGTMTGRSASQA